MSKQVWTIDKLTAYYTALADVSGAHMQRIVDWAVANDRFIESEAEAPLFSIAGKKSDRLFAGLVRRSVLVSGNRFEPQRGVKDLGVDHRIQ